MRLRIIQGDSTTGKTWRLKDMVRQEKGFILPNAGTNYTARALEEAIKQAALKGYRTIGVDECDGQTVDRLRQLSEQPYMRDYTIVAVHRRTWR